MQLTCFALIGCTLLNWVSCVGEFWNDRRQLHSVGEGVYSDATQLNSTSSLSCVGEVSIATRRRNSTRRRVELSSVAINGPWDFSVDVSRCVSWWLGHSHMTYRRTRHPKRTSLINFYRPHIIVSLFCNTQPLVYLVIALLFTQFCGIAERCTGNQPNDINNNNYYTTIYEA